MEENLRISVPSWSPLGNLFAFGLVFEMVLKVHAGGATADVPRSWNRLDIVHLGRPSCHGLQLAARRYPEPQYLQRARYEARPCNPTLGLGLRVGTGAVWDPCGPLLVSPRSRPRDVSLYAPCGDSGPGGSLVPLGTTRSLLCKTIPTPLDVFES